MSETLIALATLAIAFSAWMQWWTTHQKLKLDLFEKRYAVYAAAMDLMRTVFHHGHATYEQIVDFRAKTADAQFLLDEKISAHLLKITNEAFRLNALREELEPLPRGAQRSANVQEQRVIKDWIRN
jgi:hypothetical protein